MNSGITELRDIVSKEHIYNFSIALTIFVIGYVSAGRLKVVIGRAARLQAQQRLLLTRLVYYGILFFAIAAALGQIGVDIRVLLGTAGVLTVAVGFAAQTSASNLISGLFLMIEKPFVIGDIISIGDLRGEVLAIDLVSSQIRTLNNLLVRIPNETMLKSNIINYSFFPLRRLDFNLNLAYEADLQLVEKTLREVTLNNPLCLDNPRPVFLCTGLTEASVAIQLQVWTTNENLIKLQNELFRETKLAFEKSAIRFPSATHSMSAVP
jgi:small-conductance mechanosensitive channel